MPLSDVALRNARGRAAPYRLADGRGLYALVQPSGAIWWRFDYRFAGKRKSLSFGTYPDTKIAAARAQRERARELVEQGIDPSAARREGAKPSLDRRTEAVARAWWATRCPGWSEEYRTRILNRLEQDVFPEIGETPIDEVGSADILVMLRKIEARGVVETVHRVKNYVSEFFGFALGQGLVATDPTGPIDAGRLLKPKPPARSRSALKASQFPAFLAKLAASDEERDTVDAIRLVLWALGRTDEIRFAHRDEFEAIGGAAPLWRLPPGRMKPHGASGARFEHLVPLPLQALPMLRRRIDAAGPDGRLFARPTRSGVISENTMLYALYRLGYHSRATVHGFRGSFSTIANEATRIVDDEEVRMWDSDWIERCLAHVEPNKVRGAYNAAEYIGGRRRLLQWWADWLDGQEAKGRADEFAALLRR